jgi:phosphoribosyl-AMP cyclohydrolase
VNEVEEGKVLRLDFGKIRKAAGSEVDLMPVVVQNADTGEVILLAYTNETAFKQAVRTRKAVFWSASRNELWEKGRTSGNTFDLVGVFVNCEQNSLLYTVRANAGGICHTTDPDGISRNCFYRRLNLETMELEKIDSCQAQTNDIILF